VQLGLGHAAEQLGQAFSGHRGNLKIQRHQQTPKVIADFEAKTTSKQRQGAGGAHRPATR
jgi:hypothetical protein